MKLPNVGFIRYHIKKLRQFDDLTKFRLQLLISVTLLVDIIIPVYSQYYGLLHLGTIQAATILAFFGILKKIGIKMINFIMDNFSFSNIFLNVIALDILWAVGTATYFISPQYMVWCDLFVSVLQLPFIWAFSNSLNNYITYFHSEKYTNFQNYKNDILAEVGIIGLVISIILTYIGIKIAIITFIFGMLFNAFFQIKNFKLFRQNDFKYMYNYKKNRREAK